ncbi:MAG: hypothetical protein ABSB76_30245 [Streptosporangiaceae bacterium]
MVIAEKVRFSEPIETTGVAADELVLPLLGLEDEELLQAAAARHTASETDATAAPFLATLPINTTLYIRGRVDGSRSQACIAVADLAKLRGLSVLATTIERRWLTWP